MHLFLSAAQQSNNLTEQTDELHNSWISSFCSSSQLHQFHTPSSAVPNAPMNRVKIWEARAGTLLSCVQHLTHDISWLDWARRRVGHLGTAPLSNLCSPSWFICSQRSQTSDQQLPIANQRVLASSIPISQTPKTTSWLRAPTLIWFPLWSPAMAARRPGSSAPRWIPPPWPCVDGIIWLSRFYDQPN
jgi:hypothetical protein